jgi:hypothetical protein
VLQIPLDPGLPDGRWACLRPLCGRDELAIPVGDLAATHLVDNLLVRAPGTSVGPGDVWSLSVTDRDRLLAGLYRHHFGDRIEGSTECRACGEDFDLGCDVSDLLAALEIRAPTLSSGPDEEGAYALADGRRFRVPTADDQRCALEAADRAGQMLRRCLLEGDAGADDGLLEAALAEAAPVLDLDLSAPCPECGAVRNVPFAIERHLLGALASERRWLVPEVHSIARSYHWPLADILALAREDRRAYVRLIEAERKTTTVH